MTDDLTVRGAGQLVVAAAVLCAAPDGGGRLLAARRARPAALAGRWELPGGKVEPGEPPADALAREIREELGCVIEVQSWLPGDVVIDPELTLRAAVARLVSGTPRAREHAELRWVDATEMAALDWLEPDRPFLSELVGRLG